MKNRTHANGFTLLEVLIALIVFTIGLFGLAGMLMMSVRSNQNAYLRTQATFLAQSIVERMRANLPEVWLSTAVGTGYAGTFGTGSPNNNQSADPCRNGNACTSAQVAMRDLYYWNQQLTTLLPGSSATITCTADTDVTTDPTTAITVSTADMAFAPFNGYCTLAMTWSEASLDRQQIAQGAATTPSAPPQQTLNWVFQP